MRIFLKLIFLIIFGQLLLGCAGSNLDSPPVTNYHRSLSFLVSKYGQIFNPKYEARISKILNTLDLNQENLQVIVIKDQNVNAYTAGGNAIVFTEGLLKNISNDNYLCFILAHEWAHIKLKHHQLINFNELNINRLELQADQYAFRLLKLKLPNDYMLIKDIFFDPKLEPWLRHSENGSYPSPMARYKNLEG